MESNANHWKTFFLSWPVDLSRRGIVVTSFNEQISFSAFWTSEDFLLLERQTPDSQGARSVVVPYEQLLALKITDVVKAKHFKAIGFEGMPSKA
ncbi:MAG TPA: hypothetical protein VIH42_09010 [Thermoguttaceae bacterium]